MFKLCLAIWVRPPVQRVVILYAKKIQKVCQNVCHIECQKCAIQYNIHFQMVTLVCRKLC